MSTYCFGVVVMVGSVVILIVFAPPVVRLVVTTLVVLLATESCNVELVMARLLSGDAADPMVLVTMSVPLVIAIVLVPPPATIVLAFTVPLEMVRVPSHAAPWE